MLFAHPKARPLRLRGPLGARDEFHLAAIAQILLKWQSSTRSGRRYPRLRYWRDYDQNYENILQPVTDQMSTFSTPQLGRWRLAWLMVRAREARSVFFWRRSIRFESSAHSRGRQLAAKFGGTQRAKTIMKLRDVLCPTSRLSH
jgi:hypothetical protein